MVSVKRDKLRRKLNQNRTWCDLKCVGQVINDRVSLLLKTNIYEAFCYGLNNTYGSFPHKKIKLFCLKMEIIAIHRCQFDTNFETY